MHSSYRFHYLPHPKKEIHMQFPVLGNLSYKKGVAKWSANFEETFYSKEKTIAKNRFQTNIIKLNKRIQLMHLYCKNVLYLYQFSIND